MEQDTNGHQFEYIIVDNNSPDNTKEVVQKYVGKNKNIDVRYKLETTVGCNYARNTGIKVSKGEYLIFFDDDVVLEKNCLLSYVKAFEENPDKKIFGGRIILKQPDFQLPSWFVTKGQYLRPMIVLSIEHGEGNSFHKLPSPSPYSLNMAIKRSAFDKYGAFDTYYGLSGKSLMPGADYELFVRFSKSISEWVYVGKATVFHPLKKSQATKKYFRKRLFGVGRVTYKLHKFEAKRTIFGLPLYFIGFVVKNFLLSLKYFLLLKPVEQFYYETEFFLNCGCVYEHFKGKKSD